MEGELKIFTPEELRNPRRFGEGVADHIFFASHLETDDAISYLTHVADFMLESRNDVVSLINELKIIHNKT